MAVVLLLLLGVGATDGTTVGIDFSRISGVCIGIGGAVAMAAISLASAEPSGGTITFFAPLPPHCLFVLVVLDDLAILWFFTVLALRFRRGFPLSERVFRPFGGGGGVGEATLKNLLKATILGFVVEATLNEHTKVTTSEHRNFRDKRRYNLDAQFGARQVAGHENCTVASFRRHTSAQHSYQRLILQPIRTTHAIDKM
jgi:hypothetical protein